MTDILQDTSEESKISLEIVTETLALKQWQTEVPRILHN